MLKTDTILTHREAEVVRGYVDELNGKEIANECCMAYRTVVNHTQNAFEKAGCQRSIHALVSWWYKTNFPEIAQKIGAMALLLLLTTTFTHFDDTYVRRVRRTRRTEQIEAYYET